MHDHTWRRQHPGILYREKYIILNLESQHIAAAAAACVRHLPGMGVNARLISAASYLLPQANKITERVRLLLRLLGLLEPRRGRIGTK